MFLTNIQNTKLQKIADLFDQNTVAYSKDDLQESFDNLKNLFVLLAEGEVERVNSSHHADTEDRPKFNPYDTIVKDNTGRILPKNITLTKEEVEQLKRELENFYFTMQMLNSARESFLKHSSNEIKESRIIQQIEIQKRQLGKVKELNFVSISTAKERQAEELKTKGNVDYIFTDIMEFPIQDEYGNWYYEGYIG